MDGKVGIPHTPLKEQVQPDLFQFLIKFFILAFTAIHSIFKFRTLCETIPFPRLYLVYS
ncbi:MAG: hypothetical protein KBA60_13090 [Flavobacteriales bacterium]|nr:hypothetical protein [Flavobacteriales bacterium]MBP7156942.1 hypothetical protein [Flavobacteriales bacterium]HQW42340.1 hypothetical protein [Flavobacteriales bacterium]